MDFWDRWFSIPLVLAGIISGIMICAFLIAWGTAEWNKHNAPIAFAQCAQMCGSVGVHRADPGFKCECNETKRFEGSPSLDLNIRNGTR